MNLEKLKENDDKMRKMKEMFGDAYFKMFGELILNGMPIQDAIDTCYEYFSEKMT